MRTYSLIALWLLAISAGCKDETTTETSVDNNQDTTQVIADDTDYLATFENSDEQNLTIVKPADYDASLFVVEPQILDNPAPTTINSSDKCMGCTNVANADWWGNFIKLNLKQTIKVSTDNRYLTLQALRTLQPKTMRIGINGYESSNEVYCGSLSATNVWENLSIDLVEAGLTGQTINSIWIVFSCNWTDPRSGWGEASYYFDNFKITSSALPAQITINSAEQYQTIQDFAASDCWTAEYVADYFSEAQKEQAAKWLFSQDIYATGNLAGIGLSCWRVNLGAGSSTQGSNSNISDETRRAECYLSADGTYDWTRCNGQQYFMQKAKEYGVPHFLLFSNSAPIYYTKNGLANMKNSGEKCNLKDDCYDDFAEFLATTTDHFLSEGYNITYIDPINEPQFDWNDGQEGSPWENENIAQLVRQLDASLTKRGLSTEILMPEAAKLTCLYAGTEARANNQIDAFWNSSNTDTYIGNLQHVAKMVAGHSYWTFSTNDELVSTRQNARDAAAQYGLNVMQTEWSMLGDAPSSSAAFPTSYDAATKMDIALYMGKIIHTDLAIGNMTGWSYWTAFAQEMWSQKNRFYLIRMNATGDTGEESYGDIKKGGTLTADKNLWVLGNYSRFVRPGSKRISLNGASEMNGLLGSAYISNDNSQIIAVFVNMNATPIVTTTSFVQSQTPISMSVYVTDASSDLHRTTEGDFTDTLTIGARSVTTIVYNLQ